MRPVSAAFLSSLTGSHPAPTRITAPDSYQSSLTPTGGRVTSSTGGAVIVDGTADVRSTLDVSVPDSTLWPESSAAALAPYGQELFVERGIRFADGSVEWVGLGYYRVDSVEQDDAPRGGLRVTGSDRAATLVDSRLPRARSYSASTTLQDFLDDLVAEIYPSVVYDTDLTLGSDTLGSRLVVEEGRWKAVLNLAKARSRVAFFDERGRLSIRPEPSATATVWTIAYGENGVLVSAARELSREGAINGVLASSESATDSTPVSALIVDGGALSPTLWGGPFGRIPQFFYSPLMTSQSAAAAAATTLLARKAGLPYRVTLGSVPNAALEPGDAITVRMGVGQEEVHVIERVHVPLDVSTPQRLDTRQRSEFLAVEL